MPFLINTYTGRLNFENESGIFFEKHYFFHSNAYHK